MQNYSWINNKTAVGSLVMMTISLCGHAQGNNLSTHVVLHGLMRQNKIQILNMGFTRNQFEPQQIWRYSLQYITITGKKFEVNFYTGGDDSDVHSRKIPIFTNWAARVPTTEPPREIKFFDHDEMIGQFLDDSDPLLFSESSRDNCAVRVAQASVKWDNWKVEISTDLGKTWDMLSGAIWVDRENGMELQLPQGFRKSRAIYWVQTRKGLKIQQHYYSPEFGSASRLEDLVARMK